MLDELLAEYANPEDLTGPDGLLKWLAGALVEGALQAEMTDHLGYEQGAAEGQGSGNSRNGVGKKTLRTDQGEVTVEVPRDRNGTFEPKLVTKHQRSSKGFDDKILSMYARDMSVREIQAHLPEIYGTEVSPDLISSVTNAVSSFGSSVLLNRRRPRGLLDSPCSRTTLLCEYDAARAGARVTGSVGHRGLTSCLADKPAKRARLHASS